LNCCNYGDGCSYVNDASNDVTINNASNANNGDDSTNASGNADTSETVANSQTSQGFPTDSWPELGIVTYAGEYGASQGQVIMNVVPGSAADKAGLVAGDVILTFNGQAVASADDLDAAMSKASGKFEVSVWDARTGRKSTLDGTLDPAASRPAPKTTAFAPAG
jgi:S1-C subfamily serine protease